MAGALRRFGHAWRRNDFAGEFVDGANVNELAGLAAVQNRGDIILEGANGRVGRCNAIPGWADAGSVLGERALLLEPFLAAAVDQADILVAVQLQLPEGVRCKPVVIVAIKNDRGVVRNAGGAEKFFERGLVNQIAADAVLKLCLPIPADRSGNVALIVRSGVNIDFDETRIRRI